ncbi:MAG: hypothetical protein ILA39_07055 [Bacteroidaceae bacterium]|nr:hypothetical protein [Bacteroidaceae bacterium]
MAYVFPNRSGNTSYKDVERNENPQATTIERIADLLQCPIDDLFDREVSYIRNHITGDNNTIGDGNIHIDATPEALMETNRHLRDIINRQDKTIEELNRRIDQLIELAKH